MDPRLRGVGGDHSAPSAGSDAKGDTSDDAEVDAGGDETRDDADAEVGNDGQGGDSGDTEVSAGGSAGGSAGIRRSPGVSSAENRSWAWGSGGSSRNRTSAR